MNKTKQISIIIDNDPDVNGSIIKTITDDCEYGHRLEFSLNCLSMVEQIQKISEFVNADPSRSYLGTEELKLVKPKYDCWDVKTKSSSLNEFIKRILIHYFDEWDNRFRTEWEDPLIPTKREILETKLTQELWDMVDLYQS